LPPPIPRVRFGGRPVITNGKIGIFTTTLNGNHDPNTQKIINLAKSKGMTVEVFHPEDVTLGVGPDGCEVWINGKRHITSPYQVVLPRLGARYVTPYALTILRQLEHMGAVTVNSAESIRTAEDKFATHQAFAAHGVPQPRTFHTMSPLTHKQLI